MTYKLFEIPSESGSHADVVWADLENPDRDAFTHLAYAIETSESNVKDRRGIRLEQLRDWNEIQEKLPSLFSKIDQGKVYEVGESVLDSEKINKKSQVRTVLRLGALELLANIYSGRITASDKDPFPHQLALQQYVKSHESNIKRILIADEVGLGKTIEVGLILRDKLITQKDNLRCLYLTSGGLRRDVEQKLRSVMKDAGEEDVISVVDSFSEYGKSIPTKGIRIASMHAARLYLDNRSKQDLKEDVRPNIVIIDECHHCASNGDLSIIPIDGDPETTQAYKAAYQIITGRFWKDSEPPELVILMSATPFRSSSQFTNLLRLLTHQVTVENAYTQGIDQRRLLESISEANSPVSVIWRQQDEIRNWSDKRLFPNLRIVRPHREGHIILEKPDEAYLETLKKIKKTVQRIYRNHRDSFGGFQTADLETRLTSSSLAGACWLFRWCVRHHPKWQSERVYTQDQSPAISKLRELIREISKCLAAFDERRDAKSGYAAEVLFPSDSNFSFESTHLREGSIPRLYEFQKKLLEGSRSVRTKTLEEDDTNLVATSDEILEMTNLALAILSSGRSVENAKLNWLRAMLEADPKSRFLVFTDILQTTSIITANFPKQSLVLTGTMSGTDRANVVKEFYEKKNNYRILVATSAADEGLDFQVANKVVHWDLSPDPAILMQRNGRVARLGQTSDVTAYYLILEGTLAEKRDSALLKRLENAGINDPRMQEKIFGQLDSKQKEKISNAIKDNGIEVGTIDQVIITARQNSNVMENELRKLSEHERLQPQWVIDRDKLYERLIKWQSLDVASYDIYKHQIKFKDQEWVRPVFGEEKTEMEYATAKVLRIRSSRGVQERYIHDPKPQEKDWTKLIFDPEFGLFGQVKDIDGLAGLLPWDVPPRDAKVRQHRANRAKDLIGSLSESLARQPKADFMVISAQTIREVMPEMPKFSYMLFATHPLRELEASNGANPAKYLTYYLFDNDFNQPINLNGASAVEVHKMICFLEDQAQNNQPTVSSEIIVNSKIASKGISEWLSQSVKLGSTSFLSKSMSYFVPVPIALIAIVDDPDAATLENKEDEIQEKFTELADQWIQDVEGMSSTVEMSKHPIYQEIINMGQSVIPFLLQDLSQNPLYWLTALRQITQENPVQPEHKGKIKLMAQDWLNWGKQQGYVA